MTDLEAAYDSDTTRLLFAAERTLLAWIRTGLAMMGFGFVVARFGLFLTELAAARGAPQLETHHLSQWIGTALVLLGVFVNVKAAITHRRLLRELAARRYPGPSRMPMGIGIAILLALIGLAMTAYLFLLSGSPP